MVEAENPHRLHPTSILDVYKVFYTLRCCGWAYGCIIIAVLHVQVGVSFRENGVWPSLYDVASVMVEAANPH